MRRSVSTALEAKILEALRGLEPGVQCVGLMEVSAEGVQKEQDLSAVQVRVYNFAQLTENGAMFSVAAEIRLNVEQAESANGGLFFDAHERFALWLERVMLGDECEELETDEAYVNGFLRTGDDKDFDTTDGVWFAVWNMTISGRVKQETTDNG